MAKNNQDSFEPAKRRVFEGEWFLGYANNFDVTKEIYLGDDPFDELTKEFDGKKVRVTIEELSE